MKPTRHRFGSDRLLALLLICGSCLPAVEIQRVGAEAGPVIGELITWQITGLPVPEHDRLSAYPRARISDAGGVQEVACFAAIAHRQTDTTPPEPEFAATGERQLLLRHRFRQAGHFSLQLLAADGEPLASLEGNVADGHALGPVRVAAGGRVLSRPGGAFMPISTNICWANGPRRLDQLRSYIDRFHAAGGNHIRLWQASWCGQIESDTADVYRHDHAWLLDEVLAHCQTRGVYVTLVLDNAYDLVHGKCLPYGPELRQRLDRFLDTPLDAQYLRRLDYLCARYAAYDCLLAWELFNELDEALIGQTKPDHMQDEVAVVEAWTRAASAALRQRDPYRRLITVSLASQPWYGIFQAPEVDLGQYHVYLPPLSQVQQTDTDGIEVLRRKLRSMGRLRVPIACTEAGYQGLNADNPAALLDPDGILLRHQAWGGLLLGGWTNGMNWWWDVYTDRHNLWSVYTPLATAVDMLDWNDPDLRPLPDPPAGSQLQLLGWQSPRQAMIWPRLAEDTWYRRSIEMQPQPQLDRGRDLLLSGFAPQTSFLIDGLDMSRGTSRYRLLVDATEHGNLYFRLPAGPADAVLIIRPAPADPLEALD